VRKIDGKFHVDGDTIIKTASGETVPDSEPLFLLRGRDRLVVPLLHHYRYLCVLDGCNDYQLDKLDEQIRSFISWSESNQGKMKQPGITRGLAYKRG
jgi:hypothetical protein